MQEACSGFPSEVRSFKDLEQNRTSANGQYHQRAYVTCLDLGEAGAPFTRGRSMA
ncbi:hypothetical protein GOA56_07700 [Sinorhizobium meliloti]|nr:hypothetical protein [Sinorhizobium meliloti]MDW9493452.1 hypothetical protein [Sinorhizobium meliloti]MDW9561302.1 hypothetical protein [Sinorhizobium meliloti]MDW9647390.1 hypothetical protein [Sinorhizobium meliloti]MQV03884.1 hypothetical protein [Sinorhizobium meliloti]